MSENCLKYFMWGYQRHFRSSLQVAAKRLFDLLDSNLKPSVTIVGIRIENLDNRHPICLEPEDCGFRVQDLSEVSVLAEQLMRSSRDAKTFYSHPLAQSNQEAKVKFQSYAEAIERILSSAYFFGETRIYVALPEVVSGYLVFVVLTLDGNAIQRHYSLVNKESDSRFPLDRSLIDATVRIFLGECQRALRFPEKASGVIERDPDELVRQAARALMYAASSAGGNFDGLYGLYDACNEIAAMRYEGAAGLGRIIIASKNHKDVKLNLELKVPIEIAQYRKVRKFLEISSPNAAIVTDSALIYGLGEVVGKYNPREESLFLVDFTSHYTWTLSHDDNALMVVSYREPCLPKERIEKEKFRDVLQRTFQDISRRSINKLWDLAIGATKQRHGAMVVISAQAEAESQRLRGQCFQIEPIELDSIYVQSVTSIDGALLVDANCVCHAIGVILDGVASEKGDSSRGARYNSAIRYLEQFGKMIPTVILIISEDGMINLIPDLKPRIRRSEIEEALEKFRRLKDLSEFDRREFNSLMGYFREKEFYLTAAECASINEVRRDLECRQGGEIWIRYPDLKENSEMNESYYL